MTDKPMTDDEVRTLGLPLGPTRRYRPMTVARKDHQCVLCWRLIAKGEEYVREDLTPWNSDNDDFFTWKAHLACDEVFAEMADGWDYEIPPVDCFEGAYEYHHGRPLPEYIGLPGASEERERGGAQST